MRRVSVAIALTLLPLAGCATVPQVTSVAEPGTDFSSYRSFGFHQPLGTDQGGYQSIVTEGLKAAVRRQLETRGLQYSETNPDLLVNFNARLSREYARSLEPVGGFGGFGGRGYYGYRMGFYNPWPRYRTVTIPYEEGTLNIDVVDRVRKQLVWEGVVAEAVGSKNLQQLEPVLEKAVDAAFTRYPVAAPAIPR